MARILVVDDSVVDRQVIINALAPKGHSMIEAVDGDEAEAKANTVKPDLIILDVVMPKKNGFEVCRAIKQNPATSTIPIIMLTSKNQDSDRFWGMKQGASEYITKPFNEDILIQVVGKYVK